MAGTDQQLKYPLPVLCVERFFSCSLLSFPTLWWVGVVMCDIEDVYEESSEGEEDVEEDELRFSSDEVSMPWS